MLSKFHQSSWLGTRLYLNFVQIVFQILVFCFLSSHYPICLLIYFDWKGWNRQTIFTRLRFHWIVVSYLMPIVSFLCPLPVGYGQSKQIQALSACDFQNNHWFSFGHLDPDLRLYGDPQDYLHLKGFYASNVYRTVLKREVLALPHYLQDFRKQTKSFRSWLLLTLVFSFSELRSNSLLYSPWHETSHFLELHPPFHCSKIPV